MNFTSVEKKLLGTVLGITFTSLMTIGGISLKYLAKIAENTSILREHDVAKAEQIKELFDLDQSKAARDNTQDEKITYIERVYLKPEDLKFLTR